MEHHRVQHRLRHRVDVRLFNFHCPGIGADLVNLPTERRHGAASDVDEIQAQIGADPLLPGGKMPGHPSRQIPLVLLGKFHDGTVFLNGLPQLFQPFVRLPGGRDKGEDHGAVIRNVCQHVDHFGSVAFTQFKQVNVVHLDQGVLCHHGQVLHRVREDPHIEGFLIQPVEVEGFRQGIQQQLSKLPQIVVQQEGFLPMEEVEPSRAFLFQVRFQRLQAVGGLHSFCHGFTSESQFLRSGPCGIPGSRFPPAVPGFPGRDGQRDCSCPRKYRRSPAGPPPEVPNRWHF